MGTPNVNFFIHSVPCLYGLGINHPLTKEYLKLRQFYACEETNNYLHYVKYGSEKKIDFIDYSGNNEKSSGVYDENGLCSEERIKQLKQNFKQTNSPIWYGLISFEEIFGKTYCNNFAKAYEVMKLQFPRFLANAGFDPKNIEWYARLHTNTDHRHIHFSFYEKVPLTYRRKKKAKCFSYGQVSL